MTYIALAAAALLILNTYPLIISRDLVFDSKRTSLKSEAALIGVSLEALGDLTEEGVAQVIDMLETDEFSDLMVIDAEQNTLYRYSDYKFMGNDQEMLAALDISLNGFDTFNSKFSDGVFVSCASVPIIMSGNTVGAVYICEYDEDQGSIIIDLQQDLRKFSIALGVFAIVLSLLFSRSISRSITNILKAIKIVHEGEYSYRIDVRGYDELAELGNEFNDLTDRLQKTEEIRRRFVADASHELKTPLASIRLLSDSIVHSTNMNEEMVREFVNDIGNEAERLARITEKLLALTRLDNNVAIARVEADFAVAVNKAVRMLKLLAENRNITLNCNISDNCTVFATEDDLYQIVFNLTENAIKYNVDGGEVNITLKTDREKVMFTVEDTGIGIPESDLSHIFDRFYRVDKARSREAGGSGLGLSIVDSITKLHGGNIKAENRENGGMRFIVEFPFFSVR